VTATAAPPSAGPAAPPGRLRRHRSSIVIAAFLLLAVVVAIWLGSGTRTATPMDPDNPSPDGARAVAQVLGDEGVEVVTARDADALDATDTDGATVLVVLPYYLGDSTLDRLLEHTRAADRLVIAGAGPGLTSAFGVDNSSRIPLGRGRDADCADPTYDGLRLEVDTATAYPGEGCWTGERGAVLTQPRDGLVLFGGEDAFTNDQVLRADNAAIALRMLGQDDRLVWYVPDLDDLVAEDGVSLRSLLPDALVPGLVLVLLTLVAVVLWRGRRLGPLATEPLPVVVRAVETTRSLGRLYRRGNDRGHAAEALRRSARTRLAERLRLGSTAPADAVVREVARRTERPEAEVAALLAPGGAVPSTDRDLITLANDLAELDREVRRT
jgi:hypothetical protein